jgi:16S rRNA (adenine1518-N6/adenine1519-N6)-dimethyltransferase
MGSKHIKPLKSLGQNFLIDEEVIAEIVDGSGVGEDSLVVEIGPGEGALTEHLAELAGHVVAVDLDERMIKLLKVKLFGYDNVELIHGDILELDLSKLIEERLSEYNLTNVRVVGNLPYYITTPIIMKLLKMRTATDSITVMMQKEVGDRILAGPGSKQIGVITYSVQYYADVSKVIDVGRESFYPSPKVDSVVLRLDIREDPAVTVSDEDFFFKTIKAGFMMRRKTLLNSLTSLDGFSKPVIEEALSNANIEANRRAESLSMEEFARLSEELLNIKNKA